MREIVDKIYPRFRMAADVLTEHYRVKGQGTTNALRPEGILLGRTFWLDLAYWDKDGERLVDGEILRVLDCDFSSLMTSIVEKVRKRFEWSAQKVSDGLWKCELGQPELAFPFVFTGAFNGLELESEPVVMCSDLKTLLVAGINDESALQRMAKEAETICLSGSVGSFVPVTRSEENRSWEMFHAERRFDSLQIFRRLRLEECSEHYRRQKEALSVLADETNVAEFFVRTTEDTLRSYCEFVEGKDALLPGVDRVILRPKTYSEFDGLEIGMRDLLFYLQGAMEPQGMVPERYLARAFPSVKQLVRLGQVH
ncbi:MAG: hypothetical protein VYA34_03050 [Myxococcota bacterium]|nr:hypothetical protein [Myxococcota bacterium]